MTSQKQASVTHLAWPPKNRPVYLISLGLPKTGQCISSCLASQEQASVSHLAWPPKNRPVYLISLGPPKTGQCISSCLVSQKQTSVSHLAWPPKNRPVPLRDGSAQTIVHAATTRQKLHQTFHLTQSLYTNTGPTTPSADPITPGAWKGSPWSTNFSVTGVTRPGNKIQGESGIRTPNLPLSMRTP